MVTTFLEVKNRAYSELAADISAEALSLTVKAGEGAKFPSTFPFHITMGDEIVSCTNRVTDTLTIVRAQQGTDAATHVVGALVKLNVTAKSVSDLNTAVNALETAPPAHTHPQYIKHSLATAVNNFLVASGPGVFVKKTLAEVKTILGLGTAAYTAATDYVTHALATAANDFLVASGSGAYIKKTLAQTLTILGKAAASGLASLNASKKVVQQPASITDHLEGTPTEDLATKAPTSEWAHDHKEATTAIHGVGAGTISSVSTANKDIYVDKAATGAADGTSYADGFTTIQDAVDSMEDVIIHAYTIYIRAGAKKTGTADFNEANKLHDADASFASGDVGKAVFNVTDGTWGRVAAFVDSGELTLDADTFPDGNEVYVIIGTPYRETVYLNSLPATYPSHSILGSVTIRAEHYWGAGCDAQANAGEILDADVDFTNVELGDRVFILDMNGGQGRCQDYEVGTVDDISQVAAHIVRTTLTKTPTTNWKYVIVKTEISGSDDGTDGGTARDCFSLTSIDNVTISGFYFTFSDTFFVYCTNSRNIVVQYLIAADCDFGFGASTKAQATLYYAYIDAGNYGVYSISNSYLLVVWGAVSKAGAILSTASHNSVISFTYAYFDAGLKAVDIDYFSYGAVIRSTISANVTTGVEAQGNSYVRVYHVTNSATTPVSPVGTTEGAYIG